VLSRGGVDDATAARAIGTIKRNAKVQAQLIEDLLDVSRMISGKLRLSTKPIPLTAVIKAAVDAVNPAFEEKGVQLVELAGDAGPVRVVGDEGRLQQVFWNLLSNALKFTPKGGRVQIKAERTGSQAGITVSDTGEGITPEFLPHVFEAFRQADSAITRKHGGLGLGLAIVRRLVEMHGGIISVTSGGRGQGAAFTVSIPILSVLPAESAAADPALVMTSEETAAKAALPNLTGIRVLAVDDDSDTRAMITGVLEQSGANVLTAGSAEEALDVLPGWEPDVLVFDIGMPHEDGNVLIQKVRQLESKDGRNTPAIALTAYTRVEDRVRALAAGYQMFIPKPIEASELVMTIANLTGQADGKD
jgi:CheY-like chemotaxis protein